MKKFKLILTRGLILTLLAVLTSTVLMAQSPTYSGGNGSEGNPFQISSTFDWNTFAGAVNGGNDYDGVFFKLMNNITVTVNNTDGSDQMVGTWTSESSYNAFSGTFDGNWKTLTFNVGKEGDTWSQYNPGEDKNPRPTAPFSVIDGATIKNLYVEGKIVSTRKYNAGLVGHAYTRKYTAEGRNNEIINCTSSIEIDCSHVYNEQEADDSKKKRWDCSSAGFVCENKQVTISGTAYNSRLYFTNCIFDGSIYKGTNDNANRGAGFVSFNNSTNNVSFTNCLMAGYIDLWSSFDPATLSTFSRPASKITYNSGCLYCVGYGNVPKTNCTQASKVNPGGVYKIYTVSSTDYYVPVTVTVTPELINMPYTSYTPFVESLSYYGKTLVKDTDYTILEEKKINGEYTAVEEITQSTGAYRVTIESIAEGDFEGSKVYTFRLLSDAERWQNLVDAIAAAPNGDTITLPNDYVADLASGDAALTIRAGKTLTINLNGHTIDRNLTSEERYGQVIRIEAGAKLTINGKDDKDVMGTITGGFNIGTDDVHNGDGAEDIDGGGIHNLGTLVLNGVTIAGNHCIKRNKAGDDDKDWSFTGRGGGIYAGINSSLTMTDCVVSNNTARGGGGGVFCNKASTFVLNEVTIENNKSESKGGGIRILSTSTTATLTDCIIQNNIASDVERASEGGGVYMQDGNLNMTRCTISGNQSTFAGAGFFALNGTIDATNCTITNNTAYIEHTNMYGGGICLHNPSVYTMDGGTITGNHSFQDGGGIYVFQGAIFNVKGNVQILDNFRTRTVEGEPNNTENNAYMAGSSVMHIVGPLTTDARIRITGHGFGGIYTSGLSGNATTDNFLSDDKYVKEIDEATGEFRLVPYDWRNGGAWADQTWNQGAAEPRIPTIDDNVVIHRAVMIPEGYTAYANSVDFTNGTIVIKEGGQLITAEDTPSTPVEMMMQKTIEAVGADDYGWYTISIPIENAELKNEYANNTNLITKKSKPFDFDLLRYEETKHYWDSYTDDKVNVVTTFTTMTKGRGYLYRNQNNLSIEFYGYMNSGDVTYNVTYTPTVNSAANPLAGVHLIGNPYPHNIYKGKGGAIDDSRLAPGYYTLTKGGSWATKLGYTDPILPCQGILVQATEAFTLTIKDRETVPSAEKRDKGNIMFAVSNSDYEDIAYALFGKGHGLNKIEHINENAPMVYIRQNDEDYAIATIGEGTEMLNLCFKTKTTGRYTLKVNLEGKYSYLHLIDRLTGENINLLEENEYSFVASITDKDERFFVLLGENAGFEDDEFAYQNGSDIVMNANGELQVFDVMGRLVMQKHISGMETVGGLESGVYVIRIVGEGVKTQKIVVR